MSKNNENEPLVMIVPIGTLAATATLPAGKLPKKSKILSVSLQNGAALTADDTNYLTVSLQKVSDSSVIGSISSKATGGNGSLVANTALDGTVSAPDVNSGESLKVVCTKFGTGVPTSALLVIQYFPL